ncbi:MAG: GAF domain-containing sensor histidine kinase [Caldilinea sp.]|uniref:GAF domain-containing sensor histidine kinase n=1 Tax=Caldilinea sp. TaxID=2293560 RepID=UPI002C34CB28|nr:GAF domain-containing sensor histidine kinase [Caldilinea sp.]
MTYQIVEPIDIQHLQQVFDALEAESRERERSAAALALRNAELHRELQQRLAESESFGRVLVSLLQKTVLEQVLDVVCAEAQSLIGATGSAVLLLTDQAWLEVRHRLGQPLTAVERLPIDGSLAGQVVRQGEPVRLNDPALFAQAQVYQWPADLTALLALPLHVNGGIIGVLDVVNKVGGFTDEDVRVMSVFANQAAMAIEHARLQQQAEQLAVLEERQRLARELHDSVTQALYSVTLYANAVALALAAGKDKVAAGYLAELQETALEGMRDMRLLIFQLHPPVLEKEGLVAALQARLAAVEERAGLQTQLRVEGERRLPIAIEEDLYWIAQEALNNVRKHAAAGHVTVHLRFTASIVRLEVIDDGVGFDLHAVCTEGRGIGGLRSIAERTARLGGRLSHTSVPGEGTQLIVEVTL